TPSAIWCRRLEKSSKCRAAQLWGWVTNHRGPEDKHAVRHLVMHTEKNGQPNRVRPKRWLIDTNLWSSVADANLGSDLIKAARRKDIEILAAPSVLYELLRTPNESVRKRFVDVITLPHWKRLMPETFSETKEILAEIRRLRPDWLRSTPNRGEYMRIFHDWRSRKGGMWLRARETPSKEARYIDKLGGATLQTGRYEARRVRREVNESGIKRPPRRTTGHC